jgi:hypothetical protein
MDGGVVKALSAGIVLFLVGCTPAEIKSEIDFVDTVVQFGVVETSDYEKASDAEKDRLGLKAVKALRRLKPHTDNLKRWIEGKGPADVSQ